MMYGNHPPQFPSGVGNLNQIVHKQFRPDGFAIVQDVWFHLDLLKVLGSHLHILRETNDNLYVAKGLHQYLDDMVQISKHLREIIELNSHIDLITSLAPRIKQFSEQLTTVQCQLNNQQNNVNELAGLVNSSLKQFDDMFIQYKRELEELLSKAKLELCKQGSQIKKDIQEEYSKVKEVLVQAQKISGIFKAIETNQDDTLRRLLHLEASEAVINYTYTHSDSDRAKALRAVQQSVKAGNNEDINLDKMKHLNANATLFNKLYKTYTDKLSELNGDN